MGLSSGFVDDGGGGHASICEANAAKEVVVIGQVKQYSLVIAVVVVISK